MGIPPALGGVLLNQSAAAGGGYRAKRGDDAAAAAAGKACRARVQKVERAGGGLGEGIMIYRVLAGLRQERYERSDCRHARRGLERTVAAHVMT
jgi:hypothetical protein